MSFEKRDRIVAQFHLPESPRLFIFSSVGSAGLNLSIADVVIFFVRCISFFNSQPFIPHQTQPWSAQDERQIRGRAHRQPQKNTVKAIHILAGDSSDLIMNDMALRKKDMFSAFVNKELGKGS
jgi:SNF2 family DNA or RNA helicase